jgi:hypothetical protein
MKGPKEREVGRERSEVIANGSWQSIAVISALARKHFWQHASSWTAAFCTLAFGIWGHVHNRKETTGTSVNERPLPKRFGLFLCLHTPYKAECTSLPWLEPLPPATYHCHGPTTGANQVSSTSRCQNKLLLLDTRSLAIAVALLISLCPSFHPSV